MNGTRSDDDDKTVIGTAEDRLCGLAALKDSLDRVSVPVWLVVLSDQLRIVALVSRYPTN